MVISPQLSNFSVVFAFSLWESTEIWAPVVGKGGQPFSRGRYFSSALAFGDLGVVAEMKW